VVTVLTFRFTLVPAIAVAVEGSTTKVKSWVGRTMKYPEEVAVPPEVLTWRGPVTPPVGTVTVREVEEAAETGAATQVLPAPVNLTVLALGVGRNPVPEMTTAVPTLPLLGLKLLMVGTGARTVTTVWPEAKAEFEAVMFVVPSKTAVTLVGVLVAPAGTVTLAGTVAMPGAALDPAYHHVMQGIGGLQPGDHRA
jgi:hypothetical protein